MDNENLGKSEGIGRKIKETFYSYSEEGMWAVSGNIVGGLGYYVLLAKI